MCSADNTVPLLTGNVFKKGMKSVDFNSALEGAIKLEKRHKRQSDIIKKLNRIIQKG